MNELEQILKGEHLHHAYLIEGNADAVPGMVQCIESVLQVTAIGNPDMHVRAYGSFGIDDGREIQSLESKRAAESGKKIFVIFMERMTREAQNALLKTFEEPTAGTHFFVITPSTKTLLPTLLSRMEVVRVAGRAGRERLFARQFLSASGPERLALIKEIIEEKDRARALECVNELEAELYERTDFYGEDTVPTDAFEALQSTRSYLTDQSSSVKILLEHLSLVLPQLS
ncbi:MAG: hypothetical protein OQJ98_02420 [Candidatus Pacebacteria bacterium]|nr:hypothetical protein [Candidatus Paceibacterota bacterium]